LQIINFEILLLPLGLRNAIKLTKPDDLARSISPPVGETLASLAQVSLSPPYRADPIAIGLGGAENPYMYDNFP